MGPIRDCKNCAALNAHDFNSFAEVEGLGVGGVLSIGFMRGRDLCTGFRGLRWLSVIQDPLHLLQPARCTPQPLNA